jgi:hypothetical protein
MTAKLQITLRGLGMSGMKLPSGFVSTSASQAYRTEAVGGGGSAQVGERRSLEVRVMNGVVHWQTHATRVRRHPRRIGYHELRALE